MRLPSYVEGLVFAAKEAFSRALETDLGRSLPFAEVVERFLSIAQVSWCFE